MCRKRDFQKNRPGCPSTSVNQSVGLSIQIFTQERQCAVGTRVHCLWRTPHTVCSSGGGLIAYRILDNVIKIKEKNSDFAFVCHLYCQVGASLWTELLGVDVFCNLLHYYFGPPGVISLSDTLEHPLSIFYKLLTNDLKLASFIRLSINIYENDMLSANDLLIIDLFLAGSMTDAAFKLL